MAAETIIEDYKKQGYVLTLRQLYYQFVARDIIENSDRSYKNLGTVITKARLAGLISWEDIEDRNREHHSFWYDEDPLNPIKDLPRYIQFDYWDRQPFYIEVWVEKEALGNVIARGCDKYLVPYMACKGYLSASEAWRAGMRFEERLNRGQECILLHLGDHDPSGIDMTRDNQDRLDLFAGVGVEVKRLALNMDQVHLYSPPPNPSKLTDSRVDGYIKKFGSASWELDALEPQIIQNLIETEISSRIDWDAWQDTQNEEEKIKETLRNVYTRWEDIQDLLNSN